MRVYGYAPDIWSSKIPVKPLRRKRKYVTYNHVRNIHCKFYDNSWYAHIILQLLMAELWCVRGFSMIHWNFLHRRSRNDAHIVIWGHYDPLHIRFWNLILRQVHEKTPRLCVNEKTSPNLAWVHQLHDIKNRRLCVASLNYTTFSITFETECLTLVSNRVTYVHGLPPSLPAIPPNSASSAGLHRHPASSSSLPPPPPPPPPRTHIFLLSPHYHDLSQTLTIKHPLNMILRDLETYRNQGEILEVRRKLAMACIECGQ